MKCWCANTNMRQILTCCRRISMALLCTSRGPNANPPIPHAHRRLANLSSFTLSSTHTLYASVNTIFQNATTVNTIFQDAAAAARGHWRLASLSQNRNAHTTHTLHASIPLELAAPCSSCSSCTHDTSHPASSLCSRFNRRHTNSKRGCRGSSRLPSPPPLA